MDCHPGSGFARGPVIEFQPGNSGIGVNESSCLGSINQAVWFSDDGMCNEETSAPTNSKPNQKGRPFQFEVGSEPPDKRSKISLLVDSAASDRMAAIGKMFYKTKLCKKFRAGACPFIRNCNFAHSIEELRKPPPNWKEIVAAYEEEKVEPQLSGALSTTELSEPREIVQIPVIGFNEETQGPNVRQHCRNFSSEVGCEYGDNCIFVHDEHSKDRQSVAICLLPGTDGEYESNRSKPTLIASNWKTRMCNKWESKGFCVFGRNCQFAHGFAELRHYDGGLVNTEFKDSSTFYTDQLAIPAEATLGTVDAPVPSVPYSYGIGVPSRTLPNVIQKTGDIPVRRWKGPNKISKIYGDWIDDLE